MCQYDHPLVRQNAFRNSIPPQGKVLYKIVRPHFFYESGRATLSSPCYTLNWTPGIVEAAERSFAPAEGYTYEGIHLYPSKKDALFVSSKSREYEILPVRCFAEDFVSSGVGTWYHKETAVFSKVYVSKRSYSRTRKKVRDFHLCKNKEISDPFRY